MKRSWVTGANEPTCDFPLANLPYGVFSADGLSPRCGVAIGTMILDLAALAETGLLGEDARACGFANPGLETFMATGPDVWDRVRTLLQELLAEDCPEEARSRIVSSKVLLPAAEARLHLPFRVAGYTDFFAGRQHAFNSGSILRGPENAIAPNWFHMPIAYNGRASTVVVSGTSVRRPLGQYLVDDSGNPAFGPCRRLDLELEFGAVVGLPTELGEILTVAEAYDRIFGFVLLNDWSARDIQRWEGQPLGPFQSKGFATSISPWVVPRAALESFRCAGPKRDKELLPYLREHEDYFFDIHLEAWLRPDGRSEATRIVESNTRHLYYSAPQLLTHHAINGCRMQTGDLLGSGTISGPERHQYGCLMEQSWGGKQSQTLKTGEERIFLEDGDSVALKGWAQGDGFRIGFGDCEGTILPSPAERDWLRG